MAKTTHTNRGTCQVCGAVQAIDNASGITAKHGYLVAGYGFFNGVCPGAGYVPAEKSIDRTNEIMAQLLKQADEHDREARAYAAFKVTGDTVTFYTGSQRCTHYDVWDSNLEVPKRSRHGFYKTRGGYRNVEITADTPVHIIVDTQRKAAAIAEQNARHARSHVAMMRELIVPRLGQPLYPAAEVIRTERKAAKAKAVEGVRFPTKAARKDALDKLNREYDKLRRELQNMYLALSHDERELSNRTELYYASHQLSHWRPKHAEGWVREFPQSAAIVERINALVTERAEIQAAV